MILLKIEKTIFAGIKGFLYALIATVIAVITGALSLALGYKPDGLINQSVWQYVVYPALVGLIALLKNYLQHKGGK